MALSSEQKEAVQVLRSLCTSSKDPPTLFALLRDYEEIEGCKLNFNGYQNPFEMLRASNEFQFGKALDGRITISARITAESVHIVQMLRAQKCKKRKRANRGRGGGYAFRPQPQMSSFWGQQRPAQNFPQQAHRFAPTAARSLKPMNNNNSGAYNRNYSQFRKPNFVPTVFPYNPNQNNQKQGLVNNENLLPSQQLRTVMPPTTMSFTSSTFKSSNSIRSSKSMNDNLLPSQRTKTVYLEDLQSCFQQINIQNPITPEPVAVQKPFTKPLLTPQPQNSGFKISHPDPTHTRTEVVYVDSESDSEQNIPAYSVNTDFKDTLFGNQDAAKTVYQQQQMIPTQCIGKMSKPFKPSVQERLAVIKKSHSNENFTPQGKSEMISKSESVKKPVVHISVDQWDLPGLNVFDKLELYCRLKQFSPPKYTFFKVKEGKRFKFQPRVTIDGVTYSTYPEDFETESEAKSMCATKAVDEIKAQENSSKYEMFNGSDVDLARKIYNCVREHATGVFLKEIPTLFQKEYEQTIPDHYIRLVQDFYSDMFRIEKTNTLQEIVYAVGLSPGPGSSLSSYSDEPRSGDFSISCLELPWNEPTWNVLVTFPESTTQVWCSLIGADYHEKRINLYNEIELAQITEHPDEIKVGQHYIAVVHECPYRVRIGDVKHDIKKSSCFFIDTGEEALLDNDQLFVCDEKFLELPAQAVPLSLYGLEILSNFESANHNLAKMESSVFVAKLMSTESDFTEKDIISVIIYDTSTDEDIDMNAVLLNTIKETLPTTRIDAVSLNNVTITGISDDSIISCHLKDNNILNAINFEIQKILDEPDLNYHQGFYSEETDDLYLVYDEELKRHVRGKLVGLDSINSNNIIMYLVDYALEHPIHKKNVFKLLPLAMGLNIVPPQGLKLCLYDIDRKNNTIISLLRGMLKPGTTAIAKQKSQEDGVPYVDMFIRTTGGNLQGVNEAIIKQMQLSPFVSSPTTAPSNFQYTNGKSIEKSTSAILPLPKVKIPRIDQEFQVKVISAQSINIFHVQPHSFKEEFRKMMDELQKYCNKTNDTLQPQDLITGTDYIAYVGSEDDKSWKRVKLLQSFDHNHNKVSCLDDYLIDVVGVTDMKKLPHEFRALPEQAIRAKLHGIQSNNKTEAAHRFMELTKDKNFKSIVKGIEKDETGHRILVLQLFDQNPFKVNDGDISQILINESLAVRLND